MNTKPSAPSSKPATWRPGDLTRLDEVLTEIYAKFGLNTLLVPSRNGKYLLSPEELRNLTVEKTHATSYQQRLCVNDVDILCGRANGNLCGIGVLDPDQLEPLLEDNPCLAGTVVTNTPAGVIVWLRAKDFVPASLRGACLRWLADKDVVTLRRGLPAPHGWAAMGEAVASVKVDELWLPMDARLALHLCEAAALARWDTQFLTGDKPGRRRLNPGFWAQLAGRLLVIRYLPEHRQFEAFDPDTLDWQPLSEERLTARLAEFVREHTARSGTPFLPLGTTLRPVIEEMRVQLAVAVLTQQAGVRQFVATQVIAQRGSDLTTEELNQAFIAFQQARLLPVVSTSLFELLIGPELETKFGVHQSHSLQREGRDRRGYRKIGLQPSLAPNGGTGGTGGTEG